MKTNTKEMNVEELNNELAQAVQDFYFSKGAIINKESWEETQFMIRQYEKRLTTTLTQQIREERDREVVEMVENHKWETNHNPFATDEQIANCTCKDCKHKQALDDLLTQLTNDKYAMGVDFAKTNQEETMNPKDTNSEISSRSEAEANQLSTPPTKESKSEDNYQMPGMKDTMEQLDKLTIKPKPKTN